MHPEPCASRTSWHSLLSGFLALTAFLTAGSARAADTRGDGSAPQRPPNVLFIAVDDLRPQLGCYGVERIKSPNIDRLARSALVFERAYCQVPVCGASRASLMTGLRPTRQRFLRYNTWAEKDAPGVVTLPALFRQHGYTTLSLGKVFHHRTDSSGSWSEPAWMPRPSEGNWRDYLTPESIEIAGAGNGKGPPFESADVSDDAYLDGKIASRAVADLERLEESDQPFFLAVGFLKPHLPFNAPRRYWELYGPHDVRLPSNYFPPSGAPRQALHNWGELRGYANVPARGPVSGEMARSLVRGYHACVSYTDAQIGRVLDALDALGLSQNTIVILWGDHGWNLGEHGLWCKHCNFDNALRVPLLLRIPGMPGGQRTRALAEFVDIYPTLCDLADVPAPSHLEGSSLVPLIEDPDRPWKSAVFSRWLAGDSMRTDRYLYTEWRNQENAITARMLFDHREDPAENTNIAGQVDHGDLVLELSARLRSGWRGVRPGEEERGKEP